MQEEMLKPREQLTLGEWDKAACYTTEYKLNAFLIRTI